MGHNAAEAEQASAPESQSELSHAPRPPAIAFILGAVLIAIMGASIAILFLFSQSSWALGLASTGIAASLVGLGFLVYGNNRRIQLISEFSMRAAALMVAFEDVTDTKILNRALTRLRELEKALLILQANDEALKISQWRLRQAIRAKVALDEDEWRYGPAN